MNDAAQLASLLAAADAAHAARQAAEAVAAQAEHDYVTAAEEARRAGAIDWYDMHQVYERTRRWGWAGWQQRWRDLIGMTHHEVRRLAIATGRSEPVVAAYGPRTWDIARDIPADIPPHGVNVVYTLWDVFGERLYVGTSGSFYGRLNQHESKPWARCTVREAPGQAAAEGLEAVEILAYRPPMNAQVHYDGGPGQLRRALKRAGLLTSDREAACAQIASELRRKWVTA